MAATTDHSFDPGAVDDGGQVAGGVVRGLLQGHHVAVHVSRWTVTLLVTLLVTLVSSSQREFIAGKGN